MTSVLDGPTAAEVARNGAAASALLDPTVARDEFADLVQRVSAAIEKAVSTGPVSLDSVVKSIIAEVAPVTGPDTSLLEEATSEAVLQLLSRRKVALTPDLRLHARR